MKFSVWTGCDVISVVNLSFSSLWRAEEDIDVCCCQSKNIRHKMITKMTIFLDTNCRKPLEIKFANIWNTKWSEADLFQFLLFIQAQSLLAVVMVNFSSFVIKKSKPVCHIKSRVIHTIKQESCIQKVIKSHCRCIATCNLHT